jgi:hypothetical protein
MRVYPYRISFEPQLAPQSGAFFREGDRVETVGHRRRQGVVKHSMVLGPIVDPNTNKILSHPIGEGCEFTAVLFDDDGHIEKALAQNYRLRDA